MGLVSRQRDWQLRHVGLGQCTHCSSPQIRAAKLCFRHNLFRKLKRRGLATGRLTKENKNKREKLVAHLFGRYHAIVNGFLKQVDAEQALKDATEIRMRLKIQWGGIRGAKKMADVIIGLERHAAITRKENESANTQA